MGSGRREYDSELKLGVVLELLKGQKTQAQICRERGISDDLLSRWKDVFQQRAPGIFSDRKAGLPEESARVGELERLVAHHRDYVG